MAVNETANIGGIVILPDGFGVVKADPQAAGKLAVEGCLGRILNRAKPSLGHAEIIGAARRAIEAIARIMGQGKGIQRSVSWTDEDEIRLRIRDESKIGGDEVLVRVVDIRRIPNFIAVVPRIHRYAEINLANIAGACDSFGGGLGPA